MSIKNKKEYINLICLGWIFINLIFLFISKGSINYFWPIDKESNLHDDYDFSEFISYIIIPLLFLIKNYDTKSKYYGIYIEIKRHPVFYTIYMIWFVSNLFLLINSNQISNLTNINIANLLNYNFIIFINENSLKYSNFIYDNYTFYSFLILTALPYLYYRNIFEKYEDIIMPYLAIVIALVFFEIILSQIVWFGL